MMRLMSPRSHRHQHVKARHHSMVIRPPDHLGIVVIVYLLGIRAAVGYLGNFLLPDATQVSEINIQWLLVINFID